MQIFDSNFTTSKDDVRNLNKVKKENKVYKKLRRQKINDFLKLSK